MENILTNDRPRVNIFWFRRDLRLDDNSGLRAGLDMGLPLVPVFIFDSEILNDLPREDKRIAFIHEHLEKLNNALAGYQSTLLTFHGSVLATFETLVTKYEIGSVICNHDYEPYARTRDAVVSKWLRSRGINMVTCKDQVVFEKNEVLKDDGSPYTIFTPYMKKWKSKIKQDFKDNAPVHLHASNFLSMEQHPIPDLESIGFKAQTTLPVSSELPSQTLLANYHENRDFPAKNGTSRLSVHLRFGTVSIRHLVQLALHYSETWLNELIWREFYMMILWHFPYVVDRCFKPAYDFIPWENDPDAFERWCQGTTGYSFVDAGMRELNQTGFMHNRLRMVTASFLTKHLLIDWRWGADYFATKLTDFELSSNNGGWQWAAGCGCDAAPYFRIFNPMTQAKKFDPSLIYTRRWVPELNSSTYPKPMIDHKMARTRAIDTFKNTLQNFRGVK
jgi:deoxyribodipyrimidine photo-lyase